MNNNNKKSKVPTSLDDILDNGLGEPSLEQLLRQFAASKKNIGQGLLADLTQTTARFLRLFESGHVFSISDFIIASGSLDLNTQTIQSWFEDFTSFMEKNKRVRVTDVKDSCYEFTTYQFMR